MKKIFFVSMVIGLLFFTVYQVTADSIHKQKTNDFEIMEGSYVGVKTAEKMWGGHKMIPGVNLVLESKDKSVVRHGKTNSFGDHSFDMVPSDLSYTVTASKSGYNTKTEDVSVDTYNMVYLTVKDSHNKPLNKLLALIRNLNFAHFIILNAN